MAFLTFSLYVPTFFFPLISFHYTPLFFCIFRKPLKSNLILWDFYPRTFSNIVGMIGSNSTQTDSPQTGLLFFLIAMSVFSWQVLQPYTKRRSTRLTFNGALSARHQKQAYLPYTKRRPYQPYIERRHIYPPPNGDIPTSRGVQSPPLDQKEAYLSYTKAKPYKSYTKKRPQVESVIFKTEAKVVIFFILLNFCLGILTTQWKW